MRKEIEADGYITRESDLTPVRYICHNCHNYQYDTAKRRYVCLKGHKVECPDWRMKYEVCDDWE